MEQKRSGGRFLEANIKARKKALYENTEVKALRESINRKFGFDPMDGSEKTAKEFPVGNGLNFTAVHSKLMESDSASSFPQVLRAGAQTIANAAYETVGTTYEEFTKVVASSKTTELYPPLHGIAFPGQVGPQETYPEVGAMGLDISLTNRKWGSVFSFEWELGQDDQTAQFEQQAGLMGEYMNQLVEVVVYAKLASVSNMKYGGQSFSATETKPTNESNGYPYATAASPFIGGGYNRPSSFALLGQTTLQDAKIALINQLNLLGLKMSIDGNRLLIGPKTLFSATTLLNSNFWPTAVGTGTGVGGAFSINPIKGIADLTVSRFMFKSDGTCDGTSTAWYLCDDTKPFFVVQMREPLSVIQENPESGESFNRDVIRFKSRSRFNADFIDPRFCWQGNNGSVTS